MFVIVVFFFAELIPVTIAEKGLAVAARKEPSPVVMVETTCVKIWKSTQQSCKGA
jgi:hypothetical protein